MDHTIRGTKAERESGKGGMAKQVQTNTECLREVKKNQTKILAWFTVIFGFVNFGALVAVITWMKNKMVGG